MEVLLLNDISGIGRKNDVLVVANGYALNHLLPSGKALVVTPNVRRQYAESIKKRALEREAERALLQSVSNALSGKIVHISAKASKAGKLYAGVTEDMIAESLKAEYALDIPVRAITMPEHFKKVGKHTITIALGTQSTTVPVEIIAEKE